MKTIVKFVEFAYSPTLIAGNQEHLYIVSTCYVFRFEKRKKNCSIHVLPQSFQYMSQYSVIEGFY